MLSALAVTAAFAAPAPDKVDAFVCPVLGGQAGGDHASPGDPGYTPIWNQ